MNEKKSSLLRRSEKQILIARAARSNGSTYAHIGNSGDLQTKIGVNLPKCFAAQSKLRSSYKINIKS